LHVVGYELRPPVAGVRGRLAPRKLFDMFIGLLQALIFTILTIIYFGEAVVGNEPDPH